VPNFELRAGIVHITDRYGERALTLGDFVASTKLCNKLCAKWVAETQKPARLRRLKKVKVAEQHS
jgi:hypothetical protein